MSDLNQIFEFLDIVEQKHHWQGNTAQARRTACTKLFALLEDEQKTVEYVRDNLDVLKHRFSNANKLVAGGTVEEYGRRVQLVLNEFAEWSKDRAAWERKQAAKQTSRGKDEKPAKPKAAAPVAAPARVNGHGPEHDTIVARFPFSGGRMVTVELPKEGLSRAEMLRLGQFLVPWANDWDTSARMVTPAAEAALLEDDADRE
jgi:hypothetical protein